MLFDLPDPFHGLMDPAFPFIPEGDGDDAHRKVSQFAAQGGDDRCTAGTRSTPHPRRDKYHFGILNQGIPDII